MRGIPAAFLAGVAIVLFPAAAPGAAATEPRRQDLQVVTQEGGQLLFQVEVADTDAERRQGLMYREHLGERHGMLLLYPEPREVGIWMRNTLLPLDVLFIDAGGRIVGIAHDAVPLSEETMRSGRPVRAVLEINGGAAHALGIHAGDRVRFEPLWPGTEPR